jgi:RNA polymerase sigma-70 factor (ECF subfamily)
MNSPEQRATQDQRYHEAIKAFGPEIGRFVAGYEWDRAKRQELLQEVHLALWQSLVGYKGECSLRTWVYRVAHNVSVTHLQRRKRAAESGALTLDEVGPHADERADIAVTDRQIDLQQIMKLVHSLAALDRQVMLLYLEDLDAASISDVTGLSAANVATKIHRIKTLLANRLNGGSAQP